LLRYRLRTLMIVLALGPPLLVMAYVLFVGPAALLLQSGLADEWGEDFMHWFYWPLSMHGQQDETFRKWLDWYATLWLLP
jgi:hypothetical protein